MSEGNFAGDRFRTGLPQLGFIGNCHINALIDERGRIVWSCFPRLDGDPVFCSLLDGEGPDGSFAIELADHARSEQSYLANTAVLRTLLEDAQGNALEIIDFAPRFERFERMHRPTSLIRLVRPVAGTPRLRIRLRPRFGYGSVPPVITRGSHHIRYVDDVVSLRLTTDAPLPYILDETAFRLDRAITLHLGADESLAASLVDTCREFLDRTVAYWRGVASQLHVPFEWQDAVIRSAITLKLCSFEETGAIIAAPTASLPERDGDGRNWDYRYCWLRDSYFVVRTLNRLGYTRTMADYLVYLRNIVAASADGYLQPVYGIGLEHELHEELAEALRGFRGNLPVRIGNLAHSHDQHDGYGSVILAATQAFFDTRLGRPAAADAFAELERVGDQAFARHDVPDAGLWEFRNRAEVHTHSSVMCWAACDRLARIARHLGLTARADHWQVRADAVHARICREAWSEERGAFTASFGGRELDASLLLMHEVGFLRAEDPRYRSTLAAVERELAHGPFVYRYRAADDFGPPENAFVVCSFWYIEALAACGRREEARARFEAMLALRNPLGLMSEHVDPANGSFWGNFPQTYSHVGLINCAMRLSCDWDEVV